MVRVHPGPHKVHTPFINKNAMSNKDLSLMTAYYRRQIQTGKGTLDIYNASTLQRGHGLGDIIKGALKLGKPLLRSAFKAAKPLLKKGAKRVGKAALSSGSAVLGDLLEGKNLKKSVKKRTGREFEKLKRDSFKNIQSVLRPPLTPKKSARVKAQTKKVNKRKRSRARPSDNFGHY